MMRRLLFVVLALGLWQIAYTRIHCGFEPPDCQEGECDLCHLTDLAPLLSGTAALCSPPPAPRLAGTQSHDAAVRTVWRHNRGRAPPL